MPLIPRRLARRACSIFKEQENITHLLQQANKDADMDLKWEQVFISILLRIVELESKPKDIGKHIDELEREIRRVIHALEEAREFNSKSVGILNRLVELATRYETAHRLIYFRLKFREFRDLCRDRLRKRESIGELIVRLIAIFERILAKFEHIRGELNYDRIQKELEAEREELKVAVRAALRINAFEMNVDAIIEGIEDYSEKLIGPDFKVEAGKTSADIKRRYILRRITRILMIAVVALGIREAALRGITKIITDPQAMQMKVQVYVDHCAKVSSEIKHENISFKSKDGLTLSGKFFRNDKTEKVIIVCHGMWSGKMDTMTYVEFLNKEYNVFTFDFRAVGESEGQYYTYGANERADLEGAIDFLKGEGFEDCAILGISAGAYTSMMVAQGNTFVNALIDDSGFVDFGNVWQQHDKNLSFMPGFFKDDVRARTEAKLGIDIGNMPKVNAISKPILIMHAKGDPVVPFQNAKAVYNMASGPKFMFSPDEKQHGTGLVWFNGEYASQVMQFLENYYPAN